VPSLDVDRMLVYLDTLRRARPLREAGEPQVLRGRQAFEKARCSTCHAGELFTSPGHHDVGTLLPGDQDVDTTDLVSPDCATRPDGGTCGFNVPSLLGVGRTAPYLHGGQASTLRDVLDLADRHGAASSLSADEREDLVAYLESL
jgi:cytochrome c peroxidase